MEMAGVSVRSCCVPMEYPADDQRGIKVELGVGDVRHRPSESSATTKHLLGAVQPVPTPMGTDVAGGGWNGPHLARQGEAVVGTFRTFSRAACLSE